MYIISLKNCKGRKWSTLNSTDFKLPYNGANKDQGRQEGGLILLNMQSETWFCDDKSGKFAYDGAAPYVVMGKAVRSIRPPLPRRRGPFCGRFTLSCARTAPAVNKTVTCPRTLQD